MIFVTVDKVNYSTVGASFKVTLTCDIGEVGYINAIHDSLMGINMTGFKVPTADRKTENCSEKPNNCKDEPQICDTCRYYNSNIPCGSTPSACKEADKFAEKFVDGLKKLKPKDEPQTDCAWK